MTLCDLKIGESGIIKNVKILPPLRRRLYDLGFIPGEEIVCYSESPLGDPHAYIAKSSLIALRNSEAKMIEI